MFPADSNDVKHVLLRLADSAKTIVWMADAQGTCLYLNPGASVFFSSPAQFRLADWTGIIHPDDRQRLRPVFRKVKQNREEYEVKYRIVKSDGAIRWMTSTGAPRFSDSGKFLGYLGTMSDSTRQHENLVRLIESEEEHRLLTDSSSDLISHHAADSGNYLYASPSSKRIIGFEPEELIGTSCYDSFHPDDVAVVRNEILRQVMGEKGELIEFRVRHKEGHYVWIGAKASVLLDHVTGEKLGAVVVSRDITAERLAREELQKSRDRMSAMLESIGDAFFALDRNWRVTYVNQRTADFVKRRREDLIGRIVWEAVPEILESPSFPHYRQAMESGRHDAFESYWKPADAWCDIRIHPRMKTAFPSTSTM